MAKGGLDRAGGLEVDPVLGEKSRRSCDAVSVLGHLLGGLGPLGLLVLDDPVKSLVWHSHDPRSAPDLGQPGERSRLGRLG